MILIVKPTRDLKLIDQLPTGELVFEVDRRSCLSDVLWLQTANAFESGQPKGSVSTKLVTIGAKGGITIK